MASSSSSSALDIHAPSRHSCECSIASTAPLFIPNAEMAMRMNERGTPSSMVTTASMSSGMPLPVPNAEMVRGGDDIHANVALMREPALSTWDSIVNNFLS